MNAMMLIGLGNKTVIEGPPLSDKDTERGSDTSFIDIFNTVFNHFEQVDVEESKGEKETVSFGTVIDKFNINFAGMIENPIVRELMDVLPMDWQKEFEQIDATTEFGQWPDMQKAIFLLFAYFQAESQADLQVDIGKNERDLSLLKGTLDRDFTINIFAEQQRGSIPLLLKPGVKSKEVPVEEQKVKVSTPQVSEVKSEEVLTKENSLDLSIKPAQTKEKETNQKQIDNQSLHLTHLSVEKLNNEFTLNQIRDVVPKELMLDQLKQNVRKVFPSLNLLNEHTAAQLLVKVKEYIKTKVEKSPSSELTASRFLELFSKELESKLPLQKEFIYTPPPERNKLSLSPNGQEVGQVLSRAEHATIHLGEYQPKEIKQQQFVRQFNLLVQRGVFSQKEGLTTLSIKLFPAHLGRINVTLTQIDGMLTATFLAGKGTTKELLETQISQLRQAFAQQQLQVERIEVLTEQTPFGKQRDEQSSSHQDQQENEQKEKEKENERVNFHDLLNEFNEQV